MVEKARGTGNSDLVRWIIDSSAEKLNCAMVPMNRPPPFKTHAESQATSCSLCLDEWRQPAASSKLTPRVTTLIIAGIPEGDVAYHMNELVCMLYPISSNSLLGLAHSPRWDQLLWPVVYYQRLDYL